MDLVARRAPVHTVSGGPAFRWASMIPAGFAARLERPEEGQWNLVIHGGASGIPPHLVPLVSQAARALEAAAVEDVPALPPSAMDGDQGRFIALLDALRYSSFSVTRPRDTLLVSNELRRAAIALPRRVAEAG